MTVPDVSPDLPSRSWRVALALLSRLPQAGMSRAFGALADLRIPGSLRRPVLGRAVRALGIDITEAERELTEYESLNDLFVRRLRPGLREWPRDAKTIASPVDGVVGQVGPIREGKLLQAKGRWYTAANLLAGDDSMRYRDGTFLTIYLSPRHYHRIHAPCGGVIPHARHVPGALLPVNEPSVTHIDNLFPRNERLTCWIDGPLGRVAVVAVGAYNVGRISAAFDPGWSGPRGEGWVTNHPNAKLDERQYDPPRPVNQGDEIMAFHLGSTVVLLIEQSLTIDESLKPGTEVTLGQVLAWPST
jgi:phosphatidylserine decarboxylase